MQLVGLEKRFGNQKYLSTPDRIQLASTLGLSQLQVKTWYQNRRMKWKKQVLREGSRKAPTKPKGRPKKNSIPSLSEIMQAANDNGTLISSSSSSVASFNSTNRNNIYDENSNIDSESDNDSDISNDIDLCNESDIESDSYEMTGKCDEIDVLNYS